ncbi:beta-ketoacyl synthase [Desulfopila sp. IMCC35008]|uniref:beta-ketoacyl-[acyl-carrier-protein] synthase family protein n=1 Tax=Desulfopila sp. IMCC35008 TaxID=2653858 RepID=UPI0013D316BC|nr:beta-ketoacyl-[acyl-carrier-protein] synthase family protein [Desulfopila sp. IMCC35008]
MQLNRVVITGRGAVSPFGLGVAPLIENIWAGESAVCHMEEWQSIQGLKSRVAAPVPPLDYKSLLPRNVRRSMGKMAIYATLATREAIEDSGVDEPLLTSGETGVAIGSTTGSPVAYEDFYGKYLPHRVLEEIKSGEFFKMMGHTCVANVCLALGIRGEQWAPVSACTSSSQSIGLGYLLVKTGRQQVMLCGGAEEVHASVTGVFDLLRAASCNNDNPRQACRPFDRDRDGVVCGGGSGILVLESYEHAIARGARIYGEVVGFGNVNDSSHIANPDKDSMARAMAKAMEEGGLNGADIDYVNAHATGTELGDIAEATAIAQVVDSQTPVSSLKGHLGHTLGAAGALEMIGVLEMMQRQQIIPTGNLENIDARCGQACLVTERRDAPVTTVLKNNFALGGVNTSLAIKRIV